MTRPLWIVCLALGCAPHRGELHLSTPSAEPAPVLGILVGADPGSLDAALTAATGVAAVAVCPDLAAVQARVGQLCAVVGTLVAPTASDLGDWVRLRLDDGAIVWLARPAGARVEVVGTVAPNPCGGGACFASEPALSSVESVGVQPTKP